MPSQHDTGRVQMSKMMVDGRLLKRGFWLYVCRIVEGSREVLYVGRTGDSSSAHASSPFERLGQHLSQRTHAKANSLARQLANARINPIAANFEMFGVGPIFEEQSTFTQHLPYRDKMAALEKGVADELVRRGYKIVGTHQCSSSPDAAFLQAVMHELDNALPDRSGVSR